MPNPVAPSASAEFRRKKFRKFRDNVERRGCRVKKEERPRSARPDVPGRLGRTGQVGQKKLAGGVLRVHRRAVHIVSRLHFFVGRMLKWFGWCQAECAHQPTEKIAEVWLRPGSPTRDRLPDASSHPEARRLHPVDVPAAPKFNVSSLLIIAYYSKYDG